MKTVKFSWSCKRYENGPVWEGYFQLDGVPEKEVPSFRRWYVETEKHFVSAQGPFVRFMSNSPGGAIPGPDGKGGYWSGNTGGLGKDLKKPMMKVVINGCAGYAVEMGFAEKNLLPIIQDADPSCNYRIVESHISDDCVFYEIEKTEKEKKDEK